MKWTWVAYLKEDCDPVKSKVYEHRLNYETGDQVLEFLVMLNGKKVWVNALDCVVVKKNTDVLATLD
jgi:hypothetical protein